MLFSWCFTVSSPCFYIHTHCCCIHTDTQATLIINLSNYSLTVYSIVHVGLLATHVCSFVSVSVCASVFVRLFIYLPSPRELQLSGATFPKGGLCWLRHQRGMMVAGARKPGHISCGNGVITSPITGAITAGGLQKPGNKAHRHTDGHSCGDMHKYEHTQNHF